MLFLIIRESNPALHGLKLRGGHFRSFPENHFLILFVRYTAKTKYGRFLKKLEVRVASKLLRILPEFLQEIIFPSFSLILRNPPEF
jgi:hypothetical protein